MKLSEKIYTCRKRAGLSQEALAEKLDVSRQAVSKWETAEATPELSKIPMMAKIFGVTADWLLSEEEEFIDPRAGEYKHEEYNAESQKFSATPSWVDDLPNTAGRFVRRWGWLLGVYIAILGGIIAILGAIILLFTVHATNTVEEYSGQFHEFIGDEFYYDWNDFDFTAETNYVEIP
jgi:transcriptional regulator with XRE-family HTH domain